MSTIDSLLETIFQRTRTIAVVGYSAKPERPSHYVSAFLKQKGYRVIPVNPGLAGQGFLGERVYPDLSSVPDDVDMVDIFRRSEDVPSVVSQALARWDNLQTIWMQLGIRHAEAARIAGERGVDVVEDRCPMIEYPRLMSSS
ncbi:MAG: CoA-binding protein [Pseudomonadota bacterium]